MDKEIEQAVILLQSASAQEAEEAWVKLRPLKQAVMPYLLAAYPKCRNARARVRLVFYSIPFARSSEEAFQLGLLAIKDKATLVRYRACSLLAYSLRKDALNYLHQLLAHADSKTADDAAAAIDAIKRSNHHFFVDRAHTGKTFWEVNPGDI